MAILLTGVILANHAHAISLLNFLDDSPIGRARSRHRHRRTPKQKWEKTKAPQRSSKWNWNIHRSYTIMCFWVKRARWYLVEFVSSFPRFFCCSHCWVFVCCIISERSATNPVTFYSETEFVQFFQYLPVRCALSFTVFGIGLFLPRSFALITNDHVLKMHYCRTTEMVQLETVSTFMRTHVFEMKISDLRPTEESERFGANNIICKNTGKQFFIDPAYLDDDVLEHLGFLTVDDEGEDWNVSNDRDRINCDKTTLNTFVKILFLDEFWISF